MFHVDLPTSHDLAWLLDASDPSSVSIYLPTTPISTEVAASRIELKNLAATARERLAERGAPAADSAAIAELVDDLLDDDHFWRYQARTLAIFARPAGIRTFRLANRLDARVSVSDRFLVKPLLRAVTFAPDALVLALAQGSARLWAISGDLPPQELQVQDMPDDAASSVGKASIGDRSPSGRIQGSEGQKVRLAQYARAVDRAIRPIVAGTEEPLILAAAEPIASIFRSVSGASTLLPEGIDGNPERLDGAELAAGALTVLDRRNQAQLATLRDRFGELVGSGRASADPATVAHAAVLGAVDTLLVDIDATLPGRIDPATGSIDEGAAADDGGLVDDIGRYVMRGGGRVLAVRAADLPDGRAVAAILRHPV